MKPQEKKSMWKAKGSEVAEIYAAEETHNAPPPPRPAASGSTHGTLPAGFKSSEAPKPEPKPQPRPAASGPTHGTLPAGFKPAEAPKPEPAHEVSSSSGTSSEEVAPAYAKLTQQDILVTSILQQERECHITQWTNNSLVVQLQQPQSLHLQNHRNQNLQSVLHFQQDSSLNS